MFCRFICFSGELEFNIIPSPFDGLPLVLEPLCDTKFIWSATTLTVVKSVSRELILLESYETKDI